MSVIYTFTSPTHVLCSHFLEIINRTDYYIYIKNIITYLIRLNEN